MPEASGKECHAERRALPNWMNWVLCTSTMRHARPPVEVGQAVGQLQQVGPHLVLRQLPPSFRRRAAVSSGWRCVLRRGGEVAGTPASAATNPCLYYCRHKSRRCRCHGCSHRHRCHHRLMPLTALPLRCCCCAATAAAPCRCAAAAAATAAEAALAIPPHRITSSRVPPLIKSITTHRHSPCTSGGGTSPCLSASTRPRVPPQVQARTGVGARRPSQCTHAQCTCTAVPSPRGPHAAAQSTPPATA